MAKVVMNSTDDLHVRSLEGDISASRGIIEGDVETNQLVMTVVKASTHDMVDIKLAWEEAIELWCALTALVGKEIIKERVEDVLDGRETCRYCGAPYKAGGAR